MVPPEAYPGGQAGRRGRGKAVLGGWVAAGVVVVGAIAFGGGFGRGDSVAARPDAGAAASPSPSPSASASPSPGAGAAREYRGVGLDAGSGLVLETDPPQIRPGAENGTFGYSPDGESFVSDGARGALVLLAAEAPGTLDGCRDQADRVPAVSRQQLTPGARFCVMGADGTTALVTFRQFSGIAGPTAHATLDLTVWPARQL
jgi:hypothetical protein